MTKKNFNKR